MRIFIAAAVCGLLLCASGASVAAEADGAALFRRCAACHLPDGAGVPGAYPRLAGRVDGIAATEQGRRYLVMVITKGLTGRLDVDGVTYRGVMPAQTGLSHEDVARILDFLLSLKNKNADAAPFTAKEVAEIRASNADITMQSVYSLRPNPVEQRESAP